MMADLVADILRDASKKSDKFKSVDVHKNVPLDFDVGNLLASDINPIDCQLYRGDKESYLKNIARDNTQLLINNIWELPVERVEDAIVAKLPKPTTTLPREKPVPKRRPPTKWEQYARQKGVKHKKRSNLVWDEVLKEWKPRWGYKRAKAEEAKNWLIEVPGNADPYEDQFAKRAAAKRERVAKNEYQRLRNIAKSKNIKVPKIGIVPTSVQSKDQIGKAIRLAKSSTASLGKFTKNVANEKPSKKTGKKRQFDPVLCDKDIEKNKNLAILNNLSSKKSKLNLSRAVNQQVKEDEKEPQQKKVPTRRSKAGEKTGGKNRRKGTVNRSGKGNVNRSGKGNFNHSGKGKRKTGKI